MAASVWFDLRIGDFCGYCVRECLDFGCWFMVVGTSFLGELACCFELVVGGLFVSVLPGAFWVAWIGVLVAADFVWFGLLCGLPLCFGLLGCFLCCVGVGKF